MKKRRKIGNTIAIIIAAIVLVIALCNIIPMLNDYRESEEIYQELSDEIVTENDPGDERGDDSDGTGGDSADGSTDNDAWKNTDVDFDRLEQELGSDAIGWIRFDNLNEIQIDYPIMYSSEDDRYLYIDPYGAQHTAGSIFLEKRNSPDFSDCYNIIYGHNMRSGAMFGDLRKYRNDSSCYDRNKYFTIYTKEATYRFEIFAYSNVSASGEVYTVGYVANDKFQKFIDDLVDGSMRDTGIHPTKNDKIVTLSTCTSIGYDYRFAVNAVCIDTQYR